jgi:hypothetical protein
MPTTVAAGAQAAGDAKDAYFDDIQAILLDTKSGLTPGQKAAALQKATDGLNTVLAAMKAQEKAETYQF